MGRGLGSGLEFQSARGWFSAGEACCRARIAGGACKRLSFGEGVLGSGSGYRDRIMNQGQSQVLGLELLFSVACTADQACRSGAQGKWHREKSLYTRAWVTVLQRRSGLCAAQIRQRIRFAAGKVYRHGYFVSRGASGEARTRRPQLWRHGARLFMHAALQGGQGFIATVYIDGSDESRPLNSNGRVPG